MTYRYLGNSGFKVSALSFGAWAMAALEVVSKLTDEVMARLEDILDNKPVPLPDLRDG